MAQKYLSPSHTEILEFDQANVLVATYIHSPCSSNDEKKLDGRIDVVIPENSTSYTKSVLNAFLPAGYPNSVSSDYLEYQIYDSLQAFSSSIAGLLSSRAVLEGLGVGDVDASPTSALLLSVLQESMGRVATILFAHRLGTSLSPECKRYRFLADIFNDLAMILDCLSPVFPRSIRVGILGGSSVLRALCGVAAGSSKASLSAHFAKEGNLGELNAKDSSQETIISLLGMLTGTLLISHITTKSLTWIFLLTLLSIHLFTNYLAVRAVCMRTLNRQRANLVFSNIFSQLLTIPPASADVERSKCDLKRRNWEEDLGRISHPTPDQIRIQERIFEQDGVLRINRTIKGHCQIGVQLASIISSFPSNDQHSKTTTLTTLLSIFATEKYLLYYTDIPHTRTYFIVLKYGAASRDILSAWMLAVYLAMESESRKETRETKRDGHGEKDGREEALERIEKARKVVDVVQKEVFRSLAERGWDLDEGALETSSGWRVRVGDGS